MHKLITLNLVVIASLLALLPALGAAYEVLPISMSLSPSGSNATKDIKIINRGTVPIAIEVSMVTRQQNLDGSENNSPAGKEFVVYPQQMVIKARSTQNVRVQWLGGPSILKEKSYRYIIKQVPVNLEYAGAADRALKFSVTMEGALYIRPENTKSNIVVSRAEALGKQLNLFFTNQGTRHSSMKNARLTLIQEGRTVVLDKNQLQLVSKKNILAGSQLQFSIPLPRGIHAGKPVKGSIQYSEKYTF